MTSKHVEKNGKRQLPLEPTVGREVAAALFNAGITGEKPPARAIAWADKKHPVKMAVGVAIPSGRRYAIDRDAIDRDGKSYRWFCTTNGQSSLCGYESVIEAKAGAEAIEFEQLDGPGSVPTKSTLEDQMSAQLGGFVSKAQAIQKDVDAILLANKPFPTSKGAELVLLDNLMENPFNPRQVFEGIEELAQSIKSTGGLLVPIIARGVPHASSPGDDVGAYEIVAGARRFRALQLLRKHGVEWADKALVDIRKLSDAQVAEAMMAENDRSNLRPLEEARGFKNMLTHGHTHETIAAKLGVSKGTVIGRLKLLELSPKANKLLEQGPLTTAIATPLGRYPHALQDEALEQMLDRKNSEGSGGGDLNRHVERHNWSSPLILNVGTCIAWLQEHFTKSLKTTPWDQADDTIAVPEDLWPDAVEVEPGTVLAPSCKACPKNSNNMHPDIAGENPHGRSGAGFCTLPPCFEEKWLEALKHMRAEAKEKGEKVLGEAASKSALKKINNSDSRYAKASEVNHSDPKKRTWGQLLELANKNIDDSDQIRKVVAISEEEGKAQLIEKGEVEKVLAAQKVLPKPKKESSGGGHDYAAQNRRNREKQDLRRTIATEVLDQYVEHLRKQTPVAILRHLVDTSEQQGWDEAELRIFGVKSKRELDTFIEKKATQQDLIALLYSRMTRDEIGYCWSDFNDETHRQAKELKIDLKKREKEALAAAKAGAKEEDAGEPGDDE